MLSIFVSYTEINLDTHSLFHMCVPECVCNNALGHTERMVSWNQIDLSLLSMAAFSNVCAEACLFHNTGKTSGVKTNLANAGSHNGEHVSSQSLQYAGIHGEYSRYCMMSLKVS